MRSLATLPRRLPAVAAALVLGIASPGCGRFHRHARIVHGPYLLIALRPLPGGRTSVVTGINDGGTAVGRADYAGAPEHDRAVAWNTDGFPRDLGGLNSGQSGGEADRITAGGVIVGWAVTTGRTAPMATPAGDQFAPDPPQSIVATRFDPPQAITEGLGKMSVACGADDSGRTVVTAGTAAGAVHSFLVQDGHTTDIGTLPGLRDLAANGLDAGCIVGTADNGGEVRRAFVWSNGKLAALPLLPHCTSSLAYSVNAGEDVVGSCSTGDTGFRAVIWRAGQVKALVTPAGKESEAFGINDAGDVVGECNDQACLWRGGRLIDLNRKVGSHKGIALRSAVTINNRGWIACNGTAGFRDHAYLLIPNKPEHH
ncbi:MAG: hypothetical protein ACLQVD_07040 [Capsulimonadaceae bacterium]